MDTNANIGVHPFLLDHDRDKLHNLLPADCHTCLLGIICTPVRLCNIIALGIGVAKSWRTLLILLFISVIFYITTVNNGKCFYYIMAL
jgi:hypothetical protein